MSDRVVLHLSGQDRDLPASLINEAYLARGQRLVIHVPMDDKTAEYAFALLPDGGTGVRTAVITGDCGCP